jgi:hypothetical protein
VLQGQVCQKMARPARGARSAERHAEGVGRSPEHVARVNCTGTVPRYDRDRLSVADGRMVPMAGGAKLNGTAKPWVDGPSPARRVSQFHRNRGACCFVRPRRRVAGTRTAHPPLRSGLRHLRATRSVAHTTHWKVGASGPTCTGTFSVRSRVDSLLSDGRQIRS